MERMTIETSEQLGDLATALAKAQGANDHHAERALLQSLGRIVTPVGRGEEKKPLLNRIMSRVRFGMTDCWHWCGATNAFGYGRMTYSGRLQVAHRLSWTAHNGPITDGLSVLHTCDNASCINPAHLWLGTYSDNLRDAWAKGRNKGRTGHKRIAQ
jgi:hypothetical protein